MYPLLNTLEKFGMNLGLERINFLLKKLDNPQIGLKVLHVAGTNGKGSVASMLASILVKSGYKVGLYTSPHLFDVTERIQINNKNISRPELSSCLKQIEKIIVRMKEKPTVFEVLTAAAFCYFAKKQIDYVVLEVGLGGRLDSTNVCNPLVSIITNIENEHTDVLGKTIEKIASEKAGIIKPKVPVITAEIKPDAIKVIKKVCEANESILLGVEPEQELASSTLVGKHQRVNAACAIAAIRVADIDLTPKAIAQGLKNVNWLGRFQIVSKWPLVIVDGAHNPAGASALRQAIAETYPEEYTIIFGCSEGKDFKNMLKELEIYTGEIIFTRSNHKLAADPRYLYNHFGRSRTPISMAYSAKEAIKLWDKKKPLLIFGSLFLVADVLKFFKNNKSSLKTPRKRSKPKAKKTKRK